jgi:hypothetical protein
MNWPVKPDDIRAEAYFGGRKEEFRAYSQGEVDT